MPNFIFPVISPDAQVSSGIGPRWGRQHSGLDIAAPTGSPIVAPIDLTITRADIGSTGGYGNVVYGVDNQGNQYRFGHMQDIHVQEGMTVGAGFQLGTVGSTGRSTGPHLHYEVRDSKGNLLADATNAVVSEGKKLLQNEANKLVNAGKSLASSAAKCGFNPACMLGNAAKDAVLGDGDDCGPLDFICKLRKWLESVDFIERTALFLIAGLFIVGGVVFLAKGYVTGDLIKKVGAK